MESTPRLYDTLVDDLSQHANWVDRRHLKTLAWMMVGLMQAGMVSLTAWAPYVHSHAVYAQSLVRRFDRWLQNQRIEVHQLYGPPDPARIGRVGHKRSLSGARHLNIVGDVLSGAHCPHLSGTSDSNRVEGASTSEQ
jgi:hypothetical protein